MAYTVHNYTNPGWTNEAPPPVNQSNLNDISSALEALNITQEEANNIGGSIGMTLGQMLQQMNADTLNRYNPYTTDYKWERYSQTVGISANENESNVSIAQYTNPTTIQYCASFKCVNGQVQMNNPVSISYPTTTVIPANVYVYAPSSNCYIKIGTSQVNITTSGGGTTYVQCYGRASTVQAMLTNRTWVTSPNIGQYPANGYKDDFLYKRVTTDSMWNFYPEIVTYVGTGIATSDNPLRINFKVLPKAIRWLNNAGVLDKATIYGISIYSGMFDGAWLCTKDMSNYTWYEFVTYWDRVANVGIHARINGANVELYADLNAGSQAMSFIKGIWNVLVIY